MKASNFAASMSRWGDCNENAAVEGFLQILKPQRIKRKTYDSREEAKADVFDHIEMFQNHVRRHGNNDRLSPVKIERQYFDRQAGV